MSDFEMNSEEEHQRLIYRQILSDVGLEEDSDSEVVFTGPYDPFVDSPYYLGEGFAALAGAVTGNVRQCHSVIIVRYGLNKCN